MKIVITGAAGFIGSALSLKALSAGHNVYGIDAVLNNLYPNDQKYTNIAKLSEHNNFKFLEADLRYADFSEFIAGAKVVIHCAAMPGLDLSWKNFELYESCNLTATNRLLHQVDLQNIDKFIFISTSSVYGKLALGDEKSAIKPVSPYGVTKAAAEMLIHASAGITGLPFVILRLFSVYGPGQRADMAYHKLIKSMILNEEISIYGDGNQSRSNTYIDDVTTAILLAVSKGKTGETYNIGGSEDISLNHALRIMEEITNISPNLKFLPPKDGDQLKTKAIFLKAEQDLNYSPVTLFSVGLRNQISWLTGLYDRTQPTTKQ
jgi:UDP-glucuronate 4-epimerase